MTDKAKGQRRTIVGSLLIQKKYRLRKELAGQSDNLKKNRSDMTCINVVHSIQDVYRSQEVSREMLTVQTVKKDLRQRRIMEVTVAMAYEIWKSKHPETDAIKFRVFQMSKPVDVLLLRKNRLNQ